MTTTAGRRTGPKPRFTVRDAVDAALRVGVNQFTMAEVAKELGVATTSLYRVVESREELVTLCLRRAARDLRLPDAPTWQEQLHQYVDTLWEVFERHHGLDLVLLQHPGAHAEVQDYFRRLTETLTAGGFPGEQDRIDFVLDFLGDTTVTTHISVAVMRRDVTPGHTGLDQAREKLAAEATRHGGPTHLPADDSWLDRGFLDRKVTFIIRGIEKGL